MKLGSFLDPFGIKDKLAGEVSKFTGIPKGVIDPFGPDGFGGAAGRSSLPGTKGFKSIEEMIAEMGGDKNGRFNVSNASNVSSNMGTSPSSASGDSSGGGGAGGGGGEGIMGLLKGIMDMFGGGGGGGMGAIMGIVSKFL